MSSSSSSKAVAAPWRSLFLEHVSGMKQALFTFSTLHPIPSSAPNAPSVVPRARTCVMRGVWGTMPENDKNKAPRNPEGVYESDLPIFTTDCRMDKVPEIFGGSGLHSVGSSGSGGGGAVEAVFWATEPQTQWRVRGTAWVLGPDIDGEGGRAVREALEKRMRTPTDGGKGSSEESWSWSREITGHFGNLSPGMRGTFRNPAPGTLRSVPPKEGEGLGQKVEDLDDELARTNFRVVVIVPTEVDQVDLSNPEDVRRYLYTFVGQEGRTVHEGGKITGEWEKVEFWP
ncbi:putative zn 2cys6 transcription factor protein [Phaeoacremonium minimum UCRPA7]|uniref:Putative zn 2cys6 transcription factor protein n=1 Tax=Phaeoacremonium minimum (strain UCR-PA7) TaxID=1286976 RepID=R8BBB6_PHAM7|nr:putative zn 2cys6 transcription factor protein [Phaeoacremonium minimum UCRPA7]EON96591.1 putative zn 2cys6 transcription factor protein [Phaeoacremonium minimum UCRPA7]